MIPSSVFTFVISTCSHSNILVAQNPFLGACLKRLGFLYPKADAYLKKVDFPQVIRLLIIAL